MKTNKIILLFSILATFFIACTGEKGAIGPQGVAGQQGPKGDKGDTGASGEFPKTQTGNFTIKPADWKAYSSSVVLNTDDSFYFVVPVKELTKDILDKGIISTYWVSSSGSLYPLPRRNFSIASQNSNLLAAYYLEKGEGKVRIDLTTTGSALKRPTGDLNFRWTFN
jgi:hypothetical protein